MAFLIQCLPLQSQGASLTVEDDVVVKFGPTSALIVRDRLIPGKGMVLTSQHDASLPGKTSLVSQPPAPRDWGGVYLEKSATLPGTQTLDNLIIRYAGGDVGEGSSGGAALTLRNSNLKFSGLQISDSALGLHLLESANPTITSASFLRNTTGIKAEGNSAPAISGGQFAGNTQWAIDNKSPDTLIQATGNWWGHSSGPLEMGANPKGQGDPVSTGVNFGSYLVSAPLLNPSLRLVNPVVYQEQHQVLLDLSCLNATEYRLAENGFFAGVNFQPLSLGHTQVSFTTSAGDGAKKIDAQCRGTDGTIVSTSLPANLLIDTQLPNVTLITPAAGSLINQPITLEASASDASGIAQLRFYIDGQLVNTRTTPPYTHAWNTDASVEGSHTIQVIATDNAGRNSEQSVVVTLSRIPAAPDTEGPTLSNITVNAVQLTEGVTLTSNSQLSLSATDRSGITRIELLLDGNLAGTASSTGGNIYTLPLVLDKLANGNHTLTLRAQDSLGNLSTLNYTVTVAHTAPDAPTIIQPDSGLTTRSAELIVSGTARTGNQIQLFNNDQPVGPILNVGSDGRFNGALTLTPGVNRLQAVASDLYGTSVASNTILVTLDLSVPGNPDKLTATAQTGGTIRLTWTRPSDPNVTGYDIYRAPNSFGSLGEAFKVNPRPLTTTIYDDLPPQDGTWSYRVVSLNAGGTTSLPSNEAQAVSDRAAPRASSIIYTSQGKTDPVTGRLGQGRVNLVLTVSEALAIPPYLAIVPQGGTPIPIELLKTGDFTYSGSFLIDSTTPAGTANALFSARDNVGNRGTDVDVGATLKIDTEGPILSSIDLDPGTPIKNSPTRTIQATFTLSKPSVGVPEIKYQLSGPVRSPVSLGGLNQLSPTVWRNSFTLPNDAGLGGPEILSFSFQAKDDLDNISTKVAAFNSYQIYQGDLPPLGIPFTFTAKAQPGGKVRLDWEEVREASGYQLYRQAPGQNVLEALIRTGASAILIRLRGTALIDTLLRPFGRVTGRSPSLVKVLPLT